MKTNAPKLPAEMLAKLRAVRRRRQVIELSVLALQAAALLLALVALATALDWWFAWNRTAIRWVPPVTVLVVAGGFALIRMARTRFRQPLPEEAREIDRSTPGSEERWSTATELAQSPLPTALLGSQELIDKVAAEARDLSPRVRPANVVPGNRLYWPPVFCLLSVAVLCAAIVLASGHFALLMKRFLAPWENVTLTRIDPSPNPSRVLRHSPLEIKAGLSGRIPRATSLLLRDPSGAVRSVSLPPQKSGEEATVRYAMADVTDSFAYRFESGDAATPWMEVAAVDRPEIKRSAMKVVWPAYTKHPDSKWDALPRAARVLKGSRLELDVTTDQPLTLAAIDVSPPSAKRLPLDAAGPLQYHFSTTLNESLPFQLVLENNLGLRNLPAGSHINVFEDQPPTVKILDSSETLALRADDTLRIDFEARDDFAVAQAEVVAITQKNGEPAKETVIPIDLKDQAGKPKVRASVELDLKRLPLDADTSLSYAVRVRDNRNEGAQQAQTTSNDGKITDNGSSEKPLVATPLDPSAPSRKAGALAKNDAAQKDAPPKTPNPSAGRNTPGAKGQQGQAAQPNLAQNNAAPQAPATPQNAAPNASATPPSTPNTASSSSATNSASPSSQSNTPPKPGEAQSNKPEEPSVAQNNSAPQASPQPSGPASASSAVKPAEPSPAGKPADSALAGQNSSSKPGDKQQSQTSEAKPVSVAQNQPKPGAAESPDAAEKPENAGQPPDNMTKRSLDIGASASSKPKSVRIEQFAGKFDGDALEKQSLAIDPVLKALRDAAALALEDTEQANAGLGEKAELDPKRKAQVEQARQKLAEAIRAADELKQKSAKTPYAFFAMQADGLVANGLKPADTHLEAAPHALPARPELQAAAAHLHWVLETLDALTKQYAALKAVQKAEGILQKIKEMHMAFMEDMPLWMKAESSGAYQRSMLEVDKAYAKAFEEYLKKRRDALKELADLLAQYPELQSRFLDQTRTANKIYRDELLRMKARQEELTALTQATSTDPAGDNVLGGLWLDQLHKALNQISVDARQMAESTKTWMPDNTEPEMAQHVVATALRAAQSAQQAVTELIADASGAHKELRAARDHLTQFVNEVQEVSTGKSDYAENRQQDVEKLRAAIGQSDGLLSLVSEHRYDEALTVAQGALNSETATLSQMLMQDLEGFTKLSDEIAKDIEGLDQALKDHVKAPQHLATDALEQKTYPAAQTAQKDAATGLNKAVELLDKLMQKAVAKMDENKDPGSAPKAPTLDDLVKALQKEKRSALSLGISNRPQNIQVQTDWQKKQSTEEERQEQQRQQKEQQQRLQAAKESARKAAKEAAIAQQKANQRAVDLNHDLASATITATAQDVARTEADQNADWNTLPSQLRASLLQEKGAHPPKRYQDAIESYFKSIAGATTASPAPAAPAASSP